MYQALKVGVAWLCGQTISVLAAEPVALSGAGQRRGGSRRFPPLYLSATAPVAPLSGGSLPSQVTAVDRQRNASDEGGFVGRQEEDRPRHILRLSEPAEG